MLEQPSGSLGVRNHGLELSFTRIQDVSWPPRQSYVEVGVVTAFCNKIQTQTYQVYPQCAFLCFLWFFLISHGLSADRTPPSTLLVRQIYRPQSGFASVQPVGHREGCQTPGPIGKQLFGGRTDLIVKRKCIFPDHTARLALVVHCRSGADFFPSGAIVHRACWFQNRNRVPSDEYRGAYPPSLIRSRFPVSGDCPDGNGAAARRGKGNETPIR